MHQDVSRLASALADLTTRWVAPVLLGVVGSMSVTHPAAAQTETVLTNFDSTDYPEGGYPVTGLIQASDGNFYGTTAKGGTANYGTIFKITPTGNVTVLYSFSPADGFGPYGDLVQGTDGSLYGTTSSGSLGGYGTIFKITQTETYTVLHSFTGGYPYGGLVQGTDGNFYGTTIDGGAFGSGTVFSITPVGDFTILHSFSTAATDGSHPQARLVQGTDGNFYGTTTNGGGFGSGTVFSITPTGEFTLLHSFSTATTEGSFPEGGLVQGTDGNFYGTTSSGGANGDGTVFKISSTGDFMLLHSFASATEGRSPQTDLVQGSDGSFYGTTISGGANDFGAIFEITPTGEFMQLYSFGPQGTDSANPRADLVQGADGSFYGTSCCGSEGRGTVFRVTTASALPPPVALNIPLIVPPGASFVLSYSVANAYSGTQRQCFAANTAGDSVWTGIVTGSPTPTGMALTAPSTPGTYTYTLTCGGMETGLATLNVATGAPLKRVISWSIPAPITYGTALSAAQLDAVASVPGGFTYSPAAGTVPHAGIQTLSATFTPANTAEYTTASATVPLVVNKAPTAVTWAAPAAITYGTALSAAQLDATSTVPGSFYYYPLAGTTLPLGTQTLSVTFIPTDSADYLSSTATVPLTVNQGATPEVSWTMPAPIAYGTALSAAQLDAVSSVPGSFAYSPAAGTVLKPGIYPLSASFTPTNTNSYALATAQTLLVVEKAPTSITWVTPAPISAGTALSAAQLDATASVPGNFYYNAIPGELLPAGPNTLTVTFIPTDTADYLSSTASVTLTVSSSAPLPQTESILYSFMGNSPGTTDGWRPSGGLVMDKQGNLYGTTAYGGGTDNFGTVFKISPSGQETILYRFTDGLDGHSPGGGLIMDAQGNLYGTTSGGSCNAVNGSCDGFFGGAVFKVTPGGGETTLYTFPPYGANGAYPQDGLVMDSSGNLYGTTRIGGNSTDCGVVFKVTPTGAETVLYAFSGPDGCEPGGGDVDGLSNGGPGLTMDANGNLYGTTYAGGASGAGVVFKLAADGTGYTVLHSFANNGTDGYGALGGLALDSQGNLFGSTYSGGLFGTGVIYRVTPNGSESILFNFRSLEPPQPGLILDHDGNLYGASSGDEEIPGFVFQLAPSGVLTILHEFPGYPEVGDGSYPQGGLLLAANGNLYGTTISDGVYDSGTVLELSSSASAVAAPVFSVAPGTYTSPQTITITDATPGATIRYTLGGQIPATNGAVYGGPLTIDSSTILTAIAVAPNGATSDPIQVNYLIAP